MNFLENALLAAGIILAAANVLPEMDREFRRVQSKFEYIIHCSSSPEGFSQAGCAASPTHPHKPAQ
jgi:hypothetical protein